ncbi:SpoIIE family protein phosphatase [Streptomyces finlayi]|uniref:SpoIIE family protein phosphatase n=1 Tax=Streptomyces finlayi TaxID=67296 RepID=A0A7G7BQ41_9ACTN|nr:ATP-binding SpoIIE family protein phosphatase [Streptomyces finlayi]QNE77456.1 SpoIIE family protein phosphatase [Streptomyces finlayi]
MGPIPLQRDIVQRPATTVAGHHDGPLPVVRTSLPGIALTPSAARGFVRAALADWTGLGVPAAVGFSDRLADDAVSVANELVTNAVVHAGTTVELLLRLEEASESETAALVMEVTDHHPARAIRGDGPGAGRAPSPDPAEYGRGLHLVATLAESWGITYRTGLKTVWARLGVDDWSGSAGPSEEVSVQHGLRAAEILAPASRRVERDDADWDSRAALSFLAEASDLLAGQLDEDLVAAIAGQLLVPRLADWCAIWLASEGPGPAADPRLARVWHSDENGTEHLRSVLEKEPLRLPGSVGTGPVPVPWPGQAPEGAPGVPEGEAGAPWAGTRTREDGAGPLPGGRDGAALAYRITAGGRTLGTVLVGREGVPRVPDAVASLIEDFVRRVGLAVGAARAYTRQATISRILQRGLLPSKVAEIPGVTSALVYEPGDDGVVGGDFYDIFACPGDRWCFVLGDVQGSGPEAAVVTGLARPWLRLLAREGFGVGEVLDRLNRLLLDDAMEAAEAAALMVAAAGGQQILDGSQSRFLSLLYGEVVPLPGGGVRCTVASAGHPLPLLLSEDGSVRPAAEPQVLLGVVEDVAYESQSFDLAPGESLLCVTDGVTERRSGPAMFDDGDGLARTLAGCVGLSCGGIADRIKRAVHDFAEQPPDDDLALLVLKVDRDG